MSSCRSARCLLPINTVVNDYHSLRNKADLEKQLKELKGELLSLRVQKIAGGAASKLTKMCVYLSNSMHIY